MLNNLFTLFQKYFQYLLVIIALCCVPWMLVAKPYLMMQERKKQHHLVWAFSCSTVVFCIYLSNISVSVGSFIYYFQLKYTLFNKSLRTVTLYLVVPPVPVEVAIGKVNNDMLLSSMNCSNQCRKSNSCIFWS